MSKTYCKWPVIAAIIIASLIALSLIWCVARCLCCGVECCCGCLSCCNACCPSPRRRDKGGYQQAPPTPYQYQQPPPMHNPYFASGGAGNRSVAQTATFDSPSQKYNEDALPAMPSWSNASSRRIEQPHEEEDVELDKMDNRVVTSPAAQPQSERLLNQNPNYYQGQDVGSTANVGGYRGQENGSTGDIGYMGAGHAHMNAQPYQDYDQHRQQPVSPYGDQQRQQPTSPYGSQAGAATGYYTGGQTHHHDSPYSSQAAYNNVPEARSPTGYDRNPTAPAAYRSPMSGGYHVNTGGNTSPLSYMPNANDFHSGTQSPSYAQPKPYENNTSPPSYRSEVVSPISPPGVLTPGGGMGRKPVQGSFREL